MNGAVTMTMVSSADGREVTVMLGSRTLVLRPDEVALVDGVMRIVVPLDVKVPANFVEVVRHLPPEPEQLRLAIEALPVDVLDRLLVRESSLGANDPWPVIVKRAVGYALAGDRGED